MLHLESFFIDLTHYLFFFFLLLFIFILFTIDSSYHISIFLLLNLFLTIFSLLDSSLYLLIPHLLVISGLRMLLDHFWLVFLLILLLYSLFLGLLFVWVLNCREIGVEFIIHSVFFEPFFAIFHLLTIFLLLLTWPLFILLQHIVELPNDIDWCLIILCNIAEIVVLGPPSLFHDVIGDNFLEDARRFTGLLPVDCLVDLLFNVFC